MVHSEGARMAHAQHTGRHLILLRDGSGRDAARTLHRATGLRMSVSADSEGTIRSHPALGEGMLFHRLDAAWVHADPDRLTALRQNARAQLLAVEAERIVYALQLADPASAATALASAMSETENTWGLQATRVTASRYTGRGVRLAVLDTGLDLDHPDFAGRRLVTESFVAGAPVHDANGHGTYCAGIAGGPASPAQHPRYGIASDAELYIGKVIGDAGSGTDGGILAGIDWAVRNGCAVVSLSIGTRGPPGEAYSPVYERVAQRALAAGTLIAAAAGNDSLRPGEIAPVDHPANCPSILAVAAVDVYLRIAGFSCGGIDPHGGAVSFAAPGVAIRSAWSRPDLYRTDSGTSMASPWVAGIAALYAEAQPSARGADLVAAMIRGAQRLALPARDVGAGLIQAP